MNKELEKFYSEKKDNIDYQVTTKRLAFALVRFIN